MTSSKSNVLPFPSQESEPKPFVLFIPENEKYPHAYQFYLACEAVVGTKERDAIASWTQIPDEIKSLLQKQVQLFLYCYGIRI